MLYLEDRLKYEIRYVLIVLENEIIFGDFSKSNYNNIKILIGDLIVVNL